MKPSSTRALPMLPRAIASFGAATLDGHVYVYGGHFGRAHAHSRDNVVGEFVRVAADGEGDFEALPGGEALQGTALVGCAGRLFRVGGMTAKNASGEAERLHSTASVDSFDVATGTWSSETPLPRPRSSHDACVVDGKLYVVGGWWLDGEAPGTWDADALVADLSVSPLEWVVLPEPPFARRALAVAALGGRVAVIGGMDEHDATTAAVTIYDPATRTWKDGPEFPGRGFGVAAIGVDGAVVASGMDGKLARLDAASTTWQEIGTLAWPRFFHRLVPTPSGDVLAIGGAARGGHLRNVEVVAAQAVPAPDQQWTLPFVGAAASRHAVLAHGDSLLFYGGALPATGDRFAPARFGDQVVKVDIARGASEVIGQLGVGRQSMVAVAHDASDVLLGGLGPVDASAEAKVGSHADAITFTARDASAGIEHATLPLPRTQFEVVEHGGRYWLFGGVDFRPDAEGGTSESFDDVLVCDIDAPTLRFEPSGVTLPRPRRSFTTASIDGRVYLIGGLGEGFDPVEVCDVFHFATATWHVAPPPPVALVSAQCVVIDGRAYLVSGGTMQGQRFREDRALRSFDPMSGWNTVIEDLGFPTRDLHALVSRDRLLLLRIAASSDPDAGLELSVRCLSAARLAAALD